MLKKSKRKLAIEMKQKPRGKRKATAASNAEIIFATDASRGIGRRGFGKGRAWAIGFGAVLGIVLVFVLGVKVGLEQGWVEERAAGNGRMSVARKKMIRLEDGRMVNHGVFEGFYSDGKSLREKGEYFLGLKQGPWTLYYQDGKVEGKGDFDKGVEEGDWQYWDENGSAVSKEQLPSGTFDLPSSEESHYY